MGDAGMFMWGIAVTILLVIIYALVELLKDAMETITHLHSMLEEHGINPNAEVEHVASTLVASSTPDD